MSIYTNAVYGMRKCAGDTQPVEYPNGLAKGVEQIRTQLRDYEAKIEQLQAAGKISKDEIARLNKQLKAGIADYDVLEERLAGSEDERNRLIKDKMRLEREAKEQAKRHEEFKGSYGALGGQIWENLKKDVSDKYDQAYTWAKAKYAENPELYKQLGFIGGGAIGGGALGALLAGRGNRLIGGTLGAIGGGSAGYLAKVLAKKYGYMS